VNLFVYGTLNPDRAPAALRKDVARFKLIGKGAVRGKLLNLGSYPGLLLDHLNAESIPGHIFAIPDDPELLARLDDYEGCLPNSPQSSLVLRQQVEVTREDGVPETCWIYVYNQHQEP
jgi:gamma-glutamylcyclotransferase (GGCT)/AIG2-like uncharacterized protein YtfP